MLLKIGLWWGDFHLNVRANWPTTSQGEHQDLLLSSDGAEDKIMLL
jgi:hypothetical protein